MPMQPPNRCWFRSMISVAFCAFWSTGSISRAQIQGMNDLLWSAPSPANQITVNNSQGLWAGPPPLSPFEGFYLYVNATARAAVIDDSTRMSTPNNGFLPSAIPVPKQQYFGAPSQASVSGSGSVIDLTAPVGSGTTPRGEDSGAVTVNARLVLNSASFGPDTTFEANRSIALQAADVQYKRLFIGVGETAFADTSALPTIFDITGPSARITALATGSGTGTGRLSLSWLSPAEGQLAPGWTSIASVESPVPEIESSTMPSVPTGKLSSPFAAFPDFISTTFYSDGASNGNTYLEHFRLQTSTVIRSLGLQNDTDSVVSRAFGWGESVSARVPVCFLSQTDYLDYLVASFTIGQGIAHYVVDLQAASAMALKTGGNDALLNSSGTLIPLPVTAWYLGYMHNWTESLQSCVAYSFDQLDSFKSTML